MATLGHEGGFLAGQLCHLGIVRGSLALETSSSSASKEQEKCSSDYGGRGRSWSE